MKNIRLFFSMVCLAAVLCSSSAANQVNLEHKNEKLVFLVRWGVVRGGYATLEIEGPELYEEAGRDCYIITSRARSNKFFDTFYKVRDINKSWVDAEDFFSYGFEKDHNEGKFSRYRKVFFDYPGNKITVSSRKNTVQRDMHGQQLQDVLSALYYLRTHDIELGRSYNFDVATEKKNWTMKVHVLGKEKVEVPAGSFNCIKVKPELQDDGIFNAKGDLLVWLKDEPGHMPVLMKSRIMLGAITVELVSTVLEDFEKLFLK